MNALKYQEVIMSNLFPINIDKFGESECILHHDNATSHTANIINRTLNQLKIKNVRILKFSLLK